MRIHNFNAGPAVLPLEVLQEAQREIAETAGSGMSILEWSHRSKEYDAVRFAAEADLRELMGLQDKDAWKVLFLQGGASLQFAQIPMNFATTQKPGGYVITGAWSEKALKEAEVLKAGRSLWSAKASGFVRVPRAGEWSAAPDLSYVHITTNNTIYGTQWSSLPDCGAVPLVADMSSDILSGPRDHSKCSLIYAGAQKNLGPSGVTVVFLRSDFLEHANKGLNAMLDYSVHVKADGIYNTHPTFAVWLMGRVLAWIKRQGGVSAMQAANARKAALLYAEIDRTGFWRGSAEAASRSLMNITFRARDQALEAAFLSGANERKLIGLEGHRSAGGMRASLYNALPHAAVETLVAWMREFEARHG
ncbi:MAG: 3-phosphoserine/phosphohydroxythreonine transaminase [Planctomycetes bacterium]|nr:3-phosphoserine/phosphohydroxythreonine transaminase [Planctomycetota bacterium]